MHNILIFYSKAYRLQIYEKCSQILPKNTSKAMVQYCQFVQIPTCALLVRFVTLKTKRLTLRLVLDNFQPHFTNMFITLLVSVSSIRGLTTGTMCN